MKKIFLIPFLFFSFMFFGQIRVVDNNTLVKKLDVLTEFRDNIHFIDVKGLYGVLNDNSTDNATALMQMRTDLTTSPNHVNCLDIILFPPATTTNKVVRYSNNRWTFGIKNYIVDGGGNTFRSIYTGADEAFQRAILTGPLWATNLLAYTGGWTYADTYRFTDASAGATTITLNTLSDTTSVGTISSTYPIKVLLFGKNGFQASYPPATQYNQWVSIISKGLGTGVYTLSEPLKWNYDNDWQDETDFLGSGKHIGKPRILLLDRSDRPYTLFGGYRNFIFGNDTNGDAGSLCISGIDHVYLDRVTHETGAGPSNHHWPSENRYGTFIDCNLVNSEIDRLCELLTYTRTNWDNNVGGGMGIFKIVFNDCQFGDGVSPAARFVEFNDCTVRKSSGVAADLTAIEAHPQRLPQDKISIKNTKFTSSSTNTATFNLAYATNIESFTVSSASGNDIILTFGTYSDAAALAYYRLEPGMVAYKSDGSKGGLITEVSFNGTNYVVKGNWNVAPVAAETWHFRHLKSFVDYGGHTVTDGDMLFRGDDRLYGGNTATDGILEAHIVPRDVDWAATDEEIQIDGEIISIEVIVNRAYNGADAAAFLNITDGSYNAIAKINLLQRGHRYLDAHGAQGAKLSDVLTPAELGIYQTNLRIQGADGGGTSLSSPGLPHFEVIIRWKPYGKFFLPFIFIRFRKRKKGENTI